MRKVSLPISRTMKFPIRRPWIPYIVFVISLIITILATLFVMRSAEERDRLRFQSAVEQTQNTINNRVDTYIALLRGGSGLLAARSDITDEEFRLFVERLQLTERYPGIQGLGYAQRVPAAEKESFEQYARSEIKEDFTINPEGEREEYYPVLYLEPRDHLTNDRAPGFDGFSDPIRRNAMERARDTGLSAASGKVLLSQINGQQNRAGFLIYLPVYQNGEVPETLAEKREQIDGFIYSPFRADTLFKGIFGDQSQLLINFQIYDGIYTNEAQLLHDSRTGSSTNRNDSEANPRYVTKRTIDIAGEKWTIIYENDAQFENQSQRGLAPFILGFGLVISGVLFILSRAQFLARTAAEKTAVELLSSQKELQKAIGMRDTFISVASHELKTPVTSLNVYLEVMLRQFKKEKNESAVVNLTKMKKQIDKLTVLIHDLLDVTRIQTGKLAFDEELFDLSEIVHDIVENTKPLANKHELIIEKNDPVQVWGDKDRLGQVISNFLTNAIKYSPDANKIIIHSEHTKDTVMVSVKDFGIGIEQSHLKKIFNRFYRVTDRNVQTFPGLGIGLYICHEIIKRHGGEIKVESKKGKGSLFSFSIPLKKKR